MEISANVIVKHADDSRSIPISFFLSPWCNEVAIPKGTTFVLDLKERLSSIIPWNELQPLTNIFSSSRVSAALSILVPEKEPGQHDILATNLSTLNIGVREIVGLLFYLISNNLDSGDSGEFSREARKRDDKLLLEILEYTGWDDLRHLKVLVSSREPTAESISERLFAAALRERNFDVFQKILRAGMDPNALVENAIPYFDEIFFTPLQYLVATTTNENLQLIHLLFSHGADVNFSIRNDGTNALFYAIETENQTAIRLLLNHGAEVTMDCARAAVAFRPDSTGHFSLLEDIIDIYFDQDVARQGDSTMILEPAVMNNNQTMVQRFVSRGANINGIVAYDSQKSGYYRTTLLGKAASMGQMNLVRLLLHVSAQKDLSFSWLPYISPLAVAADRGFIDICKVLLGSGADNRASDEGRKTLLEHAVPNQDFALCQLLINHGAKIDRDPQEVQQCPSALMIAVQQGLVDIMDLLITSNARLNDVFEEGPDTILAAAVEFGDMAMATKLVNAGARNIGLRINKIGNLETAIFLQDRGFLPMLLDRSGPKLLTAAIVAHDDHLAWFLLQKDADIERNGMEYPKNTPLLAAIQTNNTNLVLALLERGVHVTDDALTKAINNANTDLLLILLVAFTGSAPTAASAAVLNSSMIYLELLRDANVDLRGVPRISCHIWNSIADTHYLHYCRLQSVLEIAAWKADYFMFKYLLEWAVSAQIDWSPESVARALTLAILRRKQNHVLDLMRLSSDLNCSIAEYGSNLFGEGIWGYCTYSPLQAAVQTQQIYVICDLLVVKRADVNYLGDGKLRRTPLQHAVELGNMEIFNLLLEHGADVNAPAADNGGATALQIAAIRGYIGIARRLLDLGADINQEPAVKNGRTALMGAAEHGRIDMLQMLLEEGALVVGEYEDYYFEAIELAEGQGHFAAARLLKAFKSSAESADSV